MEYDICTDHTAGSSKQPKYQTMISSTEMCH